MSEEEERPTGIPRWVQYELKDNKQKIQMLIEQAEFFRAKIQNLEDQIAARAIPTPPDFEQLKDQFFTLERAITKLGSIVMEIVGTPKAESVITEAEKQMKAIAEWFGDTTFKVPRRLHTPKPSPPPEVAPGPEQRQREQTILEKHTKTYLKARRKELTEEELEKLMK